MRGYRDVMMEEEGVAREEGDEVKLKRNVMGEEGEVVRARGRHGNGTM